jgi:RNA polymerase sigma-70 factor (sigma-E family)
MSAGGGTESSHDDVLLSRLYEQVANLQEPRLGDGYDLGAALSRYRTWLDKHSEDAARHGAAGPGGPGTVPAGPGTAGTGDEAEDRGALPASVTQALVAAGGAFQAPLTGGMEWSADLAVIELYAQHYRALVRLAAMLVRDTATAEEVVQDAFVAMHAGWHRLKDTEKALAYLRQAVVNRSRSVLRHRMVVEKNQQNPPPDMPSAEHGAFALLERSAVIAALRDLPARQREAIVLRYYADLSEAEIAATMGISRGAVKSHTARGMAALRTALEQELWPASRRSGTNSPSSCAAPCTMPWMISSRRQTAWARFARRSRPGPACATGRPHGAGGAPDPGTARAAADPGRARGSTARNLTAGSQRHDAVPGRRRRPRGGRPGADGPLHPGAAGTGHGPPRPRWWQIERRVYRELVTLGPAQS